jgi:hypothetical protein
MDPKHRTDFEEPDVADGLLYGRQSSATRLPGPGGDIRASQNPTRKAKARRTANRRARASLQKDLKDRLED